jgi:methyl-accepting chemotaxis protein
MFNFLANLRLTSKLFTAPSIILLFLVLLGGFSYTGLQVQNNALNEIYSVRFQSFQTSAEIRLDIAQSNANLYKLISWTSANYDGKQIETLAKETQDTLKRVEQSLQKIQKAIKAPDQSKIMGESAANLKEYLDQANSLIDLIQTDLNAATMFMGSADEKYTLLSKSLDKLLDIEKKLSGNSFSTAKATFSKTVAGLVIVIAVALMISIVVTLLMNRIILGSIKETVSVIDRLATGDLTGRIKVGSKDEIGQMASNINSFVEKLREIVTQVSQTSNSVSNASNTLLSTSSMIATGAEEASAQTGTVATASQEMAATSNEISSNCHVVALDAGKADEAARVGAKVVQNTVDVMSKIAERVKGAATTVESLGARSDQIGAIVGAIEDIADQTNLLALNAAIEAARAGEQGRGFAVVADEVRALAERTTKATKEISEMIKAIQLETQNAVSAMNVGVREVEQGTAEAGRSGDALQDILDKIVNVTMQANQIATAAEEQTATTSEITNNIQMISEVIEQTANGSQQAANAAEQLKQMADELKQAVSRFTL